MAYIYADLDDIKNFCDTRILVSLTNSDDTIDVLDETNIDAGVLQAHENNSAVIIDNFLRYLYDVPFDTPTQEIINIDAQLTICNLWRRLGNEVPQVTAMRAELMDRLRSMAKGTDEVMPNKAAESPVNR